MPRRKKGESAIYTFSVDLEDPRYAKLIAYLNEIDNGARSYVIRQILNSYVLEQGCDFTKVVPKPNKSKQPQNTSEIENNRPAEMPSTSKSGENVSREINENPIKEEPKKPKLPPELAGLKSRFS